MNSNLSKAKKEKNDEFYTMYDDIEKELIHYKEHFKDKVVYSNCDREESNFVKFFLDHGEDWGLKEFIYSSNDFRSNESIELLRRSDIVVTNPPFSLFREYVAQLMEYEKKFLIIGHQNALTYKEIFPLIKNNRIWWGFNNFDNSRFTMPSEYYNGSTYQEFRDGKLYGRVSGLRWFTNLTHQKRNQMLPLYAKQSEMNFPRYDNYDGINVDSVLDIPHDYEAAIGVPITFIDKFNPAQFEIIKFRHGDDEKDLKVDGKSPYFRILIKHKLIYDEHGLVIGRREHNETNK